MFALATILLLNFAQPGVDTLAPTLAITDHGCGSVTIMAEETRNTPDPPNSVPGEFDQIDRGVASIMFMADPKPLNVRLVLITDTQFPITPSYKVFVATVELVDPTKPGSGVVIVRDFAGNAETRLINIAATTVTTNRTQVDAGTIFVGTTQTQTVTITNTTGAVVTINDIHMQTGTRFTITQGAVPPNITLAPTATHDIVVSYEPTFDSELGDADNVVVTTECATMTIPTIGVGGVARITTEDWNAGQRQERDRICKPNGIIVSNGGNVNLVLTGATSTSTDFTYTPVVFPITIPPGANANIGDVCYEALVVGGASGAILVSSNANIGDTVAVLTAEAITTGVEDDAVIDADVIADAERITSTEPCLMFDARGVLHANLEGGLRTLRVADHPIGMYFIVYPDAPRRVRPLLLLR